MKGAMYTSAREEREVKRERVKTDLKGRSVLGFSNHSSMCIPDKGCSEVAMRYLSSSSPPWTWKGEAKGADVNESQYQRLKARVQGLERRCRLTL